MRRDPSELHTGCTAGELYCPLAPFTRELTLSACSYGKYFGNQSALVSITGYNPDLLGVYAGTDSTRHNLSLVIVNKDPSKAVALSLSGVPVGSYFLRHFGGQAGVAKYQVRAFSALVRSFY